MKSHNIFRISQLLSIAGLLVLVGCGKKTPECGDPAVESLLKSIIAENFTKHPSDMNAMVNNISETFNAPYQMYTIVTKSNFTEASSEPGALGNIKFDAFSSTKKDKDSGVNICSAMVSGDSIHRFKISASDSFINGAGKELLLLTNTTVNSFFTDAASAFNKLPPKEIAIENVKSLEAKVGANSLELKFVTALPTNIVYSANMTDKGDQVLVNVINFH